MLSVIARASVCVILLVSPIVGCGPPFRENTRYKPYEYVGDGEFVDQGASKSEDRFLLEIGPVDLSRPTNYAFRIKGLPDANFIFRLEIDDLFYKVFYSRDSGAHVEASWDKWERTRISWALLDQDQNTIFEGTGKLGRLEEHSGVIKPGISEVYLGNLLPDPDVIYYFYLEVYPEIFTAEDCRPRTRVVATAGGWK